MNYKIIRKEECYEKIDISFPRFNYEYKIINLVDVLNKMGIKDLFTNNADLSKITNDLYASNIIQKTFIDLNESGTQASAATGVILDKNAPLEEKKELIFNKPFIYIIKEKNEDNIWFIGVVNSPTEFDENKSIC